MRLHHAWPSRVDHEQSELRILVVVVDRDLMALAIHNLRGKKEGKICPFQYLRHVRPIMCERGIDEERWRQ